MEEYMGKVKLLEGTLKDYVRMQLFLGNNENSCYYFLKKNLYPIE